MKNHFSVLKPIMDFAYIRSKKMFHKALVIQMAPIKPPIEVKVLKIFGQMKKKQ